MLDEDIAHNRITYEKLVEDSHALAKKIPKDQYGYVYGIPAGGILPAFIVAEDIGAILLDSSETKFPENTLIVDDLVDSGKTLAQFKGYDTAVLYRKGNPGVKEPTYWLKGMTNSWIFLPHEKEQTGIHEHIVRLLEYIGENPTREGLRETPNRVIKMYHEMYRGYREKEAPRVTAFPNNSDGIKYDQIIIDKGYFYSTCEHHMVPFLGEYSFGYIPDKKIVGLSKIARIVDYFAARLQVQERLTSEIVAYFEKLLEPKGIILIMKARHLCKEMRGVKKINGEMTTSEITGVFRTDPSAKQEFLSLIKV